MTIKTEDLILLWNFIGNFVIILKESIRFRADKESSFIQKIKLL